MFGYVKAYKSEMKLKEYELYNAAYCGLCRAMGKCTGQCSRLTLNYDFVFLYLIRSALTGEVPTVSLHRCIVHPLKKRPMIDISDSLCYSAKAGAGLCAFKLEDDIRDSKRGKRLLHLAAFPFFKHFKKRADLPELELKIKSILDSLSKLEEDKCASLDQTAEMFGRLLGEIFAYGLLSDAHTIAYEVGFHTGKFIYAADAADDYEKDLKSGSYNPLVCIYNDSFSKDKKDSIKTAMLCELKRLEAAVNLIDFSGCRDIGEIVYNITYLGMPEQMERSLFGKNKQ